ncbi:MAG: trehalose synthase [Anaerolineae bacterium SM23_84]|nr:MAG: trehalose synthase [Anaerolineae bacterium SM23_84]
MSSDMDALWYKDAVFYELYVRAFRDSNGDGKGDFVGLVDKLDYLQELGVDCIWLLPVYASPLRDDGYDVADFYSFHPDYGTVEDFQALLAEAHRRGLRVITDLVVNHTSDQHPWFVASRASKSSSKRDYYVWSETDQKYLDARIIFLDTESSNWAYDPISSEYYWHRFFSHQPDLNFDNPAVQQAMLDVMAYWLDMGIDGFRADAVPYLYEREGTNCENLPETHAYLKRVRRFMDERYRDGILLGEANQWPEDVRPYFGDGDEFHMAFHFPVMPRLYMALQKQDHSPILQIMKRTPDIPHTCQWCTFLRNHDELTLEMVTPEEREFMWRAYAPQPEMRLNLGIRRRLAPLLDNDRRKIELLNSLLFTLPGSPIIYYGDEIGMGDNIALPDRNGVRTPMQWLDAPYAGFCSRVVSRTYSPVIDDPIYGYQRVNVEAQLKDSGSLLNFMRRIIRCRKQHPALGRGTCEFLECANRAVLAHIRRHDGEDILALHNLSDTAQRVTLDLQDFAGAMPVDVLTEKAFAPVSGQRYELVLGPYQYLWLLLEKRRD